MGIFSGIKKVFKKIAKGVGKAIKGVVKGVKKVVKKIGSSKILKALAIAAALIVTGGAAIGAFGGSMATSTFGSWMVGASQAITGFSVAGVPVGALFKPFASVGKAVGSVAGGFTDFVGFTEKAARMGYTNVGTPLDPRWVADPDKAFKAGQKFYPGGKTFETAGKSLAEVKAGTGSLLGTGKVVTGAGEVVPLQSGQVFDPTKVIESIEYDQYGATTSVDWAQAGATDLSPGTDAFAEQIKNLGLGSNPDLYDVVDGEIINKATGQAAISASGDYMTGSKWGDFALSTATTTGASLLTGYAQAQAAADDRGVMTGLATEGKEYQNALEIYSANNGFNISDIYQRLSYGTADPGYAISAELFSQPTYAPTYAGPTYVS